jgi:chromosomal replication initiation ATPase DnaA
MRRIERIYIELLGKHAAGHTRGQIEGHRRSKSLVDARQRIAQDLRSLKFSYPQIGLVMNRDHTSIMNLCKDRVLQEPKIFSNIPLTRSL